MHELFIAQADIGGGLVRGGWEYVWTAWGLTWLALASYGLRLWWRGRRGQGE